MFTPPPLQDRGPYFKEILPPTGGRVLGPGTPGNELMDLLTTSEDVIDTLMKHLSPKDLGRLECTCHVFWKPSGDPGPIELFAQRAIQSRVAPHTARRPDKSSFKRLLSCMLIRPMLLLHGPTSPASHRPQPFLYPGGSMEEMLRVNTAQRAAAATMAAVGGVPAPPTPTPRALELQQQQLQQQQEQELNQYNGDEDVVGDEELEAEDSEDEEETEAAEMRAMHEHHLKRNSADIMESLRGLENSPMFGFAGMSLKQRRRQRESGLLITAKVAVAQHDKPVDTGVRRDAWKPPPALRLVHGMLGLPAAPKKEYKDPPSGDYVHQETPRLEFIPMEDRNGEMVGHMGDGAYWTAKPVEVDAWHMPTQQKTQQAPMSEHAASMKSAIRLERCVNGGATAHLIVDLHSCTLGTLIARVLKQSLGFRLPNVAVSNTRHLFCDRAGPHGFAEREQREQTMSKTLYEHGVRHGSVVSTLAPPSAKLGIPATSLTDWLCFQLDVDDCITSQVQRIAVQGHLDLDDDSDDDGLPLMNYGQVPIAPPQPAVAVNIGWANNPQPAAAPADPQQPPVPSITDERTYGVQEHEPLRLRMGAAQTQRVVLRHGDCLTVGRQLQTHQVRVEFRWVGGDFRAADHWSDGYATEEELTAATGGVLQASAAVGAGRFAMASGPSCEGWWLAQLQGLWMAKGT